jgi:hypothetical protein
MPTQGAWECSFPMSGLSPSLPLAISGCYRLAGGRGLSTLGARRATRRASLGPARRTTLGAQHSEPLRPKSAGGTKWIPHSHESGTPDARWPDIGPAVALREEK